MGDNGREWLGTAAVTAGHKGLSNNQRTTRAVISQSTCMTVARSISASQHSSKRPVPSAVSAVSTQQSKTAKSFKFWSDFVTLFSVD